MEELKVGQVIFSKQKENSDNYQIFKALLRRKKIPAKIVEANNYRFTKNTNRKKFIF